MAGVHGTGERLGDQSLPWDALAGAAVAYLLDVDGTLLTEAGAIPGARDAIERLRRRGFPFRVLTNVTRRSRQQVTERLRQADISVLDDEVFTAVSAGVLWLGHRGIRMIAPYVTQRALEDLPGFECAGGTSGHVAHTTPEAVVVGDVGDGWSHRLLNEAFRVIMDGAILVTLQRGRYWLGPTGLEVDAGAYVAALEYATGVESVLCGKPNAAFFHAAAGSLGGPGEPRDRLSVAMVGDDLWNDVDGTQQAGLQDWLVRTGKFREEVLDASGIRPDRVIDSIAHLPV